jgi:predicted phage baseplate assembly protein
VFRTLNLPGGVTEIDFGDGVEGATLPTGQNNIMAAYRVGSGVAGNVAAGTITTLVDRPLGVSGVVNPLAASGGHDAQTVDDIRSSAPVTVVTLGRAVSIEDYQIIAETYAGIAKAAAIWIPSGRYRGVFITVAAAGGEQLQPGSATLGNLVATLQNCGNPNIAVFPQSFLETIFRIEADLKIDPAYDPAAVRAAATQTLYATYTFATRGFGQGVTGDEIAALIESVPGVVAVNVKRVWPVATSPAGDIGGADFSLSAYNAWLAQALTTPLPRPRSGATTICPYIPAASADSLPEPAEILVLDPDPKRLALGTMA